MRKYDRVTNLNFRVTLECGRVPEPSGAWLPAQVGVVGGAAWLRE